MIERIIQPEIESKFGKKKAIIVVGPRQVGKTTLLENILKNKQHLFLNCDDPTVRALLTNANIQQLRSLIGNNNIVFIDEAQRIQNIGITLKLITDTFKSVQLIASGSSALELSNNLKEPLTGRKWEYELWPISWKEFEKSVDYLKAEQQLELRIVYGMYPDVINHAGEEVQVLQELTSSYLYKDLLSYGGIRKPEILEKLLHALALQLGNEVSYNELSALIGVDKKTIAAYIDLLQKAYVIFRLGSFSRNLRNEIKTNQKIYFVDTGIRNAVIGNFTPFDLRQDKGALWENFLIAERRKKIMYGQTQTRSYFWRTVQQQEIDYVEEDNGAITGYEIKWALNAKLKAYNTFKDAYKAGIILINRQNFRDFV
ncbi:MAG TPA: ATP-binding protein [Niabella sp.]|nr:ATP-binding protein [Niabella sp.]